jgi:hypothetical protein
MLNQSLRAQCLRRGSIISLLACLIVWLTLLLTTAAQLRTQPDGIYYVSAGPLHLHTITKHTSGDSSSVSLSVDAGMVVFIAGWMLAAVCLSYLLWRRQSKPIRPHHERHKRE